MPLRDTPQERRPHWAWLGAALFFVGLLIFVPYGLCSGILLVPVLSGIIDWVTTGDNSFPIGFDDFLAWLEYLGLPILFAIILMIAGERLRKK